jgi:hypothetical protein
MVLMNLVYAQIHRIDLAFGISIEQHLDGADQLFHVRRITQTCRTCATTLAPTRFKKPKPLLPIATACTWIRPAACNSRSLFGDSTQHVGVHTTAQTLVCGDYDQAQQHVRLVGPS